MGARSGQISVPVRDLDGGVDGGPHPLGRREGRVERRRELLDPPRGLRQAHHCCHATRQGRRRERPRAHAVGADKDHHRGAREREQLDPAPAQRRPAPCRGAGGLDGAVDRAHLIEARLGPPVAHHLGHPLDGVRDMLGQPCPPRHGLARGGQGCPPAENGDDADRRHEEGQGCCRDRPGHRRTNDAHDRQGNDDGADGWSEGVGEEHLDPVDVLRGARQQIPGARLEHDPRRAGDERGEDLPAQQLQGLEGHEVPEELLAVAQRRLEQGGHREQPRQGPGDADMRAGRRSRARVDDGDRADGQDRAAQEEVGDAAEC